MKRYQAAIGIIGVALIVLGSVYPIIAVQFANPDMPLLYLSSAAMVVAGISLVVNTIRTVLSQRSNGDDTE